MDLVLLASMKREVSRMEKEWKDECLATWRKLGKIEVITPQRMGSRYRPSSVISAFRASK